MKTKSNISIDFSNTSRRNRQTNRSTDFTCFSVPEEERFKVKKKKYCPLKLDEIIGVDMEKIGLGTLSQFLGGEFKTNNSKL